MKYLFESGKFPKHWDVFQCIVNIPDEIIALREPSESGNGTSIHEEMSALKKKGSISGNGTVLNPGLKFNKEDLLAVENQALDVTPSPIDEPQPSDPLNRGGFGSGGARPWSHYLNRIIIACSCTQSFSSWGWWHFLERCHELMFSLERLWAQYVFLGRSEFVICMRALWPMEMWAHCVCSYSCDVFHESRNIIRWVLGLKPDWDVHLMCSSLNT